MSKMYTNKYFIFTIVYTKLNALHKQKIHVINILLI